AAPAAPSASGAPEGYAEMTVAEIKKAVSSWERASLAAALAHEQEHGKRKGALAALETALAHEEDES
ncbi:MAG TPA: hypothetical protein VK926_03935, partial [Gaiellaceae bacterium]|nr:hypothetical protein [Gaiellaceae bacterium]